VQREMKKFRQWYLGTKPADSEQTKLRRVKGVRWWLKHDRKLVSRGRC
jgi:hypothetical protein